MKRKIFAVAAAMFLAAGMGAQGVAQAAVPGAPTAVVVTAGNAQVAVSWTAPVSASPAVTSYTATASPGGATCTTDDTTPVPTTCTVTGLTNGTTYTFTVTATNADGTSSPSLPSGPATPATVPGAPTLTTITNGTGQVWVQWSPPGSNGGSAITEYNVSAVSGATTVAACTITSLPLATDCVTNGLTDDSVYSIFVTAENSVGTSAASNVLIARPTAGAGVPAAPTAVAAVMTGPTSGGPPGTGTAAISWTSPPVVPGFPVTEYSVISRTGDDTAVVCTVNTVGPATVPATSCTTTKSLVDDSVYAFTVTAENDNGIGDASSASNSVTPYPASAVPAAPASVLGVAGPSQVTLTWSQSASPTPVLQYEVAIASGPAGSAGTVVCTTTSALTCVASGLTANSAYTFAVRARNSVGFGPSTTSAAVTPLSANTPSAPQSVTATAGAGSATVSWAAPASTGGSAITGYTVTGTPGGTCTVTGLTCTITGLTAGTSYTFTVRASNANGAGTVSAASNAVVPTASVPGAPTGVTATAGNTQATVTWVAPASTGGAAITGYTVTSASTLLGAPVRTCTTTGALSCTVTGLTNGTPYTFTVTATNSAGTGAASAASAVVTPTGTVPTEPRNVSATAGNASAVVTWSAPTNPGSSAVTGYTVTSTPGGRTCTTTGALTCTVSGLTNETPYFFTVTATNASGTSAASTASNIVTPVGPSTANIVIEGSRDGRRINFEGESTGLAAGTIVRPWLRFPGQVGFQVGSAQRTIAADGTFSWGRNTGKKTAVQFRDPSGLRSNTVIIQAR